MQQLLYARCFPDFKWSAIVFFMTALRCSIYFIHCGVLIYSCACCVYVGTGTTRRHWYGSDRVVLKGEHT